MKKESKKEGKKVGKREGERKKGRDNKGIKKKTISFLFHLKFSKLDLRQSFKKQKHFCWSLLQNTQKTFSLMLN